MRLHEAGKGETLSIGITTYYNNYKDLNFYNASFNLYLDISYM